MELINCFAVAAACTAGKRTILRTLNPAARMTLTHTLMDIEGARSSGDSVLRRREKFTLRKPVFVDVGLYIVD
jgi:hypothetical protein